MVVFEDEVFFQQSGSTHRTFAKIGKQVIVKSEPVGRYIRALGAISDEENPRFYFNFAPVFNSSFLRFFQNLPPYSPNLNQFEKVWKKVKKESVHNKHFKTQQELPKNVFRRFNRIQGNPASAKNLIKPNLLGNIQ